MALEEYKRKRNFRKTPEPAPGSIRTHKSNLTYLIQKHAASHLHYDFRLELDGVLLSWAVTKGPSVNPADKRLAVRTEDHPLAYGSFEGTIPQGQYGGGTVMLWDTGTWEPKGDPRAGLKKGHLSFTLHGERLKGDWDLIRMHTNDKRENWLLIKEDDDEAHPDEPFTKFLDEHAFSVTSGRTMEQIAGGEEVWHSDRTSTGKKKSKSAEKDLQNLMQQYPAVQLATLVDKPPQGDQWLHEIKFDGYRLLGFLAGGDVRLRTRNGNDWTHKFPSIAAAMEKLKAKSAVVDMEAIVQDVQGRSSFQGLQNAIGDGGNANAIIAYAFDLLNLDGKDLSVLPLVDRKEKLEKLLKNSAPKAIQYSEHVQGNGDDMIIRSCEMGLEGIVSKLAEAPYRDGRQKFWLKSKCGKRQEFIILGYSDAKKGNRAIGALYLGYRDKGKIHYAGKVGTGFTMRSAHDIAEKLKAIEVKAPVLAKSEMTDVYRGEYSAIHWAKPVLLCEVAFTEWTGDGHARHPSFQGLREDKPAENVKKEDPVSVKKVAKSGKTAKTRKAATKRAGGKDEDLVLHGITITHPDRVISETGHITKGMLAEYYAAAAPLMVPLIANRPLSLLRCPSGIDGGCFYQRSPGKGLGADVYPFEFHHKGKKYEYLYIKDEMGLMELVQMGCVEIHPWGATVNKIDYPDRVIFDLDPAPDVPFEAVKLAALDLKARLEDKGYDTELKCTGGKGLHVTATLPAKKKWAEVKSFAEQLAHEMVEAAPEAYVATMSKAKRTGKIFIDYFRNDYTATAIADYAVRARPGAPVAMPLKWSELKKLKSADQFTIADALKRLKTR